ncbi:MAG: ClC family H(+)/Cl(-) exchange transporter [Pseudothermotoga sp.]
MKIYWVGLQLKEMRSMFSSALIGLVAGIVVAAYRFSISKIEILRNSITSSHGILLWIGFSIPVVLILVKIAAKVPFVSGSGIPQVKMLILGKTDYDPLKVLFYKFIGGILAIFNGFSLGREGPSIQIGSSVGQWLNRVTSKKSMTKEQLIIMGASSGLAAAFNAPLAAIAFAIEELQMVPSMFTIANCSIAAVVADLVSKIAFGMNPVFSVKIENVLPLKYYSFVILLGTITAIAGWIFEKSLLYCVSLSKDLRYFAVIIPTIFACFFILFLPEVLGGGHELVTQSLIGSFPMKTLLILLLTKFLFTLISYSSKAPGGIFLPMVSMGAMLGALFSESIAFLNDIDSFYLPNFAILGVAAFLTAVVRAPLTSIVLTAELFGSFSHFLSVMLVSTVSYMVSGFLKTKPIYEVLAGMADQKIQLNPTEEVED